MNDRIEELLEFVRDNDVKFIRLAFCDLMGVQKNISIMPSELQRAFATGISFDAHAIEGFENATQSDLFLFPNPDTMNILPWRPQQGRVIRFYCTIKNPDGSVFEFDTRTILQNTLKKCMNHGLSCKVGVESEFYLFKTDENGNATNIPFDFGTYLDIAPRDRGENIRREICLCLEEMGIKPESSHHENGPGQNEIVFIPAEPVCSADNLLTFKMLVGAIASRNGLRASFMPKPLRGKSGNGLHINLSLYRDGVNLFDIQGGKDLYSFLAGIMERISEITLFLNSHPSSYSRFGEYEAPKYITWSQKNRSQLIRIPAASGEKRRFELRSPDSCVNPYLAFALILEAGLEGIERNLELPKPLDVNLDEGNKSEIGEDVLNKIRVLPPNMQTAISFARESEFVERILSKELVETYISIAWKHLEESKE